MTTPFDYIYATMLFIAIYFQVFFLTVFFEKKRFLHKRSPEILERHPDVTFLIPCWNEESSVIPTINSVLGLSYPKENLNIIAINDGSTDRTWEMLQTFKNHPQVTLLTKPNGGKHSALNLGLTHTKTELVASFDADTHIAPDALHEAVHRFIEDKDLMALGGAVLISKPESLVQKAQSVEYQVFSFTKKMLGLVGGVLVTPGAFSLFRREVFDKIGGYREAHKLEDVELTLRMQEAGLKIDHCHHAFVMTKGPHSLRKLFTQRLRWCYGFLSNITDYRKLVFNKKYGNFGMFTLPMNIFAYILILFVFFLGLYKLGIFISKKIIEIQTVGWSLSFDRFDLFFFDTRLTTLLGVIMYTLIISGIFFGKKMSRIKTLDITSILCFIVIYSFLAPLWILKSLYNWITSKQVAWR